MEGIMLPIPRTYPIRHYFRYFLRNGNFFYLTLDSFEVGGGGGETVKEVLRIYYPLSISTGGAFIISRDFLAQPGTVCQLPGLKSPFFCDF